MQEMEAHEAQQDAKDEDAKDGDDKELDGAEAAEAAGAAGPVGRLWQTYGHLIHKVYIEKGHQLPPAFRSSSFFIHFVTKRTCEKGFFDHLDRFGSFNVKMHMLRFTCLKFNGKTHLKSGCWRPIASAAPDGSGRCSKATRHRR